MALLSELIGFVLTDLEHTRSNYQDKRNYMVEDITFEIYVKKIVHGRAGIRIVIANIGGEIEKERSHKITVKLKAK
jgi:hypothetical protein